MKKQIRYFLNRIFSLNGNEIIKSYKIEHLKSKYKETIAEIYSFFSESIFPGFKLNSEELNLLGKLYGTSVSEALYIIYYLRLTNKLAGDVCEFGVGNGATSRLLAYEIKRTKKYLYLFDSFQGLSKPTHEDTLINDMFGLGKMSKYEGTMSYSQEVVLQSIREVKLPKSRIKMIPGYIDDSLSKIVLKKVCFAYVDFDLYAPTRTALEFLDKSLVRGGFIIVDDYGFFSTGVKKSVDQFIEKRKNDYKITFPKNFAGYFCILEKI